MARHLERIQVGSVSDPAMQAEVTPAPSTPRVEQAEPHGRPQDEVRLTGISKRYPGTDAPAVEDLELTIPAGEFFSLLGPSGSGKTTTLRLIAGFEAPTTGTVWLGDKDITDLAPFKRPVHT